MGIAENYSTIKRVPPCPLITCYNGIIERRPEMGVFYICPAAGGQAVCSSKQMQAGSIPGRIPMTAHLFFYQRVGGEMLGCPFMRRHTNGGTIS